MTITKEELAESIGKYLSDKYQNENDCAYVEVSDIDDAIIDGKVDLVELSEFVLNVIK
jgi:hypothetical protein